MTYDQITDQMYLSQIYFNDRKLRRFALAEFERCLRSGRMTAFVGSMATEGLGYPDWKELLKLGRDAVKAVLREFVDDKSAFCEFDREVWTWLEQEMDANSAFDGRIISSVIGHWIDNRTGRRDAGEKVNVELGRLLAGCKTLTAERDAAILRRLIEDLQIKRFITTNYDMEIEYALAGITGRDVESRFAELAASDDKFRLMEGNQASSQRILLSDGMVIATDSFNRDRLDRLIEFSVGSTEVDFHVMHLHGRIDRPATMVVSYRDYDRLYRREGISKAPFDQALAMMHSSNPVLFVGLGMKEAELNEALQAIVGNQPFKGVGRRFVLWDAPRDLTYANGKQIMLGDDRRRAFRIEKLHKLGVLTIFNDEVVADGAPSLAPLPSRAAFSSEAAYVAEKKARRRDGLADTLADLATRTSERRKRHLAPIGRHGWRETDFWGDKHLDPVIFTWHFKRERKLSEALVGPEAESWRNGADDSALHVRTSRPGTSKGTTATDTALCWAYEMRQSKVRRRAGHHAFFANMSLRLDTDSILESLHDFLHRHHDGPTRSDRRARKLSRDQAFRKDNGALFRAKPKVKLLIVFKGLERIFSKGGLPLSAEMDQFFRSYLTAAISAEAEAHAGQDQSFSRLCRIVVFGTRRMRVYFRTLEAQVRREITLARPDAEPPELVTATKRILRVSRNDDEPSGYLRRLRALYLFEDAAAYDLRDAAVPPASLAGDHSYARETYRLVFNSSRFRNAFATKSDRDRAFAILTVMAFIGQPVEAEVLRHAPRVLKAFGSNLSRFDEIMKTLAADDVALIRTISRPTLDPDTYEKRSGFYRPRYALHMTLQAEFRERYGVPLAEATLSTSFNMSLYVAQPADTAISEPNVHEELGKLIDWFIGAYRDNVMAKGASVELDALGGEEREATEKDARARPETAACLRAALAIMRGSYSTSALLSLDLGERIVDEHRDGVLTEHADRIERLIRAFEKLARARVEKGLSLSDEDFRRQHGPGAIYRDELVWLHNERGVVKLAQGDLYEARYSLNEADRINRDEVEFACRGHNWRRIWLNQVMVDLERGKLVEAGDRIGRIENSLGKPDYADNIRKAFREFGHTARARLPLAISPEDCLAVALTTGYRAVMKFLRGEIARADSMFDLAVSILEHIDEQRACALFRRYHALLLFTNDRRDAASDVAHLAICGAESVQQMDIAYRSRIVQTHEFLDSPNAEERRTAMMTLNKAIAFAKEADLHRVAVEAHADLALLKLHGGDLESALENASIAMSLAARYGLSLEKIRLRIVLGQILFDRGAAEAASALVRNAITQADRVGYQRAVEAAQLTLLKLALS